MVSSSPVDSDKWVENYGDALFRFAMARVRDRAAAEDLVQEAFLSALHSKDRFKGQSTEKTWLFAILKHKVIDYFRKNRLKTTGREVSVDGEDVDAFFTTGGDWRLRPMHWRTNPERVQENREFVDHFYQCLAQLPERNADAFVFREIDGMSTEDICQLLDITANNCWVILYRARMLLRRCLEMAGFGQTDGAAVR